MSRQPILILGAGLSGLTLGRCLRQKGVPFVIYDHGASSPRHTYAITLLPWAYKPLLKALDMDENVFRQRVAVDNSNQPNARASNSFRANRWKLESLLREGQAIHFEQSLTSAKIPEGGANVQLHFDGGLELVPDLVIDATGVHSRIRKSLLPSDEPEIHPYAVYSGKRYTKPDVFSSVYSSALREDNVLTRGPVRPDDARLEISVNSREDDGSVSINYIYSRAANMGADRDPLHRPERPNTRATDIPKEFYEELNDFLRACKPGQPFEDCFDVEQIRSERVLHWLMRTTMIPKSGLLRLLQHGVVMIGDSAHALPILGGHGANMAILDAIGLADALEEGPDMTRLHTFYEDNWQQWQNAVTQSKTTLAEIHVAHVEIAPSL